MSKEIIYIFIGGGTGSALRYCVQLFMHERIVPYHFPWATFTVNLPSRQFSYRPVLCTFGTVSPSFRSTPVLDNGTVRWLYYLLYVLQ